jgi:hypothetical protein
MEQIERNLHALTVGQMLTLDGALLIVTLLTTYAAARNVRRARGRFTAVLLLWVVVAVFLPFYYAFARWTLLEFTDWQARASAHALRWLVYPGLMLASLVWGALALKGRVAWFVDVDPHATAVFRPASGRTVPKGRAVVTRRKRRYTIRSAAPSPYRHWREYSRRKRTRPAKVRPRVT